MRRFLIALLALLLILSALVSSAFARPLRPDDIAIADGFTIDVAVDQLAAPVNVAFDDQGRMLIAESGYGGAGDPKISRIEADGHKTILAQGDTLGRDLPITSVSFSQGQIYVVHGGTVSILDAGGKLRDIITDLPGRGDHQANSLVFKDGAMYLSIGTVTNSAVVGPDNAVFGWLLKPENRQLHDVPCKDVTLTGNSTFESDDPLKLKPNPAAPTGATAKVKTSAYAAFGTQLAAGTTIAGSVKCNGAILKANPDGSNLQVYAWGFRNPYGLHVGPDGALYVSMHGFDARGSRNVENAWDCFYKVQEGAWYGWPDFACDTPVTDAQFKAKDKPQPQFLIANHPNENPPKPIAKFHPHDATNGFAFAPSADWGKTTDAYLALFGDMTPATGTVGEPHGVNVVKLDTLSGQMDVFIHNITQGKASTHSAGGLEHPSDLVFGPDGAMYVTDWGVENISLEGIKLEKDSGVVWKVTRGNRASLPGGSSLFLALGGLAVLVAGTLASGMGSTVTVKPFNGAWTGAIAGLIMGLFAMAVASPILKLPWFAPPRVFAVMVMGRAAVANILEFDLLSFVVGLIVVLVLTAVLGVIFAALLRAQASWRIVLSGMLFGLMVWALLQYFVLPILWPLISEKGFPPLGYAVTFGVYGLALGLLLAWVSSHTHHEPRLR